MSYFPITGILPQISKNAGGAAASGYYLKGYEAGTTTPLSMGVDATPSSTLAKCALNTRGEPISNDADDDSWFIPHFNQDYILYLFQSADDADNNDTANAIWNTGDVLIENIVDVDDLPGYISAEFETVADMVSGSAINFSDTVEFSEYVGRDVHVVGVNAWFTIITDDGSTPDNNQSFYVGTGTSYIAVRNPEYKQLKGDDNQIVVLCSGQSNALGRFGGGDNASNSNVYTWNIGTSAWVVADPENDTYTTDMGTGDVWGGGLNNIAFQFCKRLQEQTGKEVYLILNAKGASEVANWDTGDYNTDLISTVDDALAASGAPARQVVDYYLWVQGERDLVLGTSYDDYRSSFTNAITELASESWYSLDDTLLIAFGVGRDQQASNGILFSDANQYLSALTNSQPATTGQSVFVNTDNTTYDDDDHYDGNSLVDLGNRAFSVAIGDEDSQRNSAPAFVNSKGFATQYSSNRYFGGQEVGGTSLDINNYGSGNMVLGGASCYNVTSAASRNTIHGVASLYGYQTLGQENAYFGAALTGDQTSNSGVSTLGDRNAIFAVKMSNPNLGDNNSFLGSSICFYATDVGDENLIAGSFTSNAVTVGNRNTFLGRRIATQGLTAVGDENVAVGYSCLGGEATSGTLGTAATAHVAIGNYAGSFLNTDSGAGNSVTLVGNNAGRYYQNGTEATAMSNVTCLGKNAYVSGDNQVQLGDSSTTTYAYGAVQDRSDERDKLDIQDLTDAHIAFFMEVEWKQFRMNYRESYIETEEYEEEVTVIERIPTKFENGIDVEWEEVERTETVKKYRPVMAENDGSKAGSRFHIGAIAQQVEEAMNKHGIDFAGLQHHSVNGGCDVYTIGYQEFIGIQGEIIQRQQARLDSIEARLEAAGI